MKHEFEQTFVEFQGQRHKSWRVCKHCKCQLSEVIGTFFSGSSTNEHDLCPILVRQRFEEIERKLSLITNGVPMGTTIQQQENDTP